MLPSPGRHSRDPGASGFLPYSGQGRYTYPGPESHRLLGFLEPPVYGRTLQSVRVLHTACRAKRFESRSEDRYVARVQTLSIQPTNQRTAKTTDCRKRPLRDDTLMYTAAATRQGAPCEKEAPMRDRRIYVDTGRGQFSAWLGLAGGFWGPTGIHV